MSIKTGSSLLKSIVIKKSKTLNITFYLFFTFTLLLISLSFPKKTLALDLSRCPTEKTRAQVRRVWDANREKLTKSLSDRLQKGDTYALYDAQSITNNLLDMADNCGDLLLVEELATYYLTAYPYLSRTSDGYRKWLCSGTACGAYTGTPIEWILPSDQFVYVLARTANVIGGIPSNSVSPVMKDFIGKYTTVIVNEHLHRWILRDFVFSRKGYGCTEKGDFNHQQYLNILLKKGFGIKPTYCNIVTDKDLWIIAASAEILSADSRSDLITLSDAKRQELTKHVDLGTRVIKSRLTETTLTDFVGNQVKGIDFDRGEWRDYPDNAYAAYSGSTFPTVSDKKISSTSGWDISHAQRFVNVFNTLYDTRTVTGQTFPEKSTLTQLANQVAYGIYNKNEKYPLFSNYWDGTDGWYRVGYAKRIGFGYAPGDRSIAFPTGGYGFWGRFNPDIDIIMLRVWNVISSQDTTMSSFRNSHYGSYYKNQIHITSEDFSSTSLNFLMILPTLVSPIDFNLTTVPTRTSSNVSSTQILEIGDIYGITTLNPTDYVIWLSHFGHKITGVANGDFNNDGSVDGIDYIVWLRNYIQ